MDSDSGDTKWLKYALGGLSFGIIAYACYHVCFKRENPEKMDYMKRAKKAYLMDHPSNCSPETIAMLDFYAIEDWKAQNRITKVPAGANIDDDENLLAKMSRLAN